MAQSPPGGWLMQWALTSANTDTRELRETVGLHAKWWPPETDSARQAIAGIERHILWPALIDKVRAGTLQAWGRRHGYPNFENIEPGFFDGSEPDFEAGSFRQGDVIFYAVRFEPAAPVPKGGRRGTKPVTQERVAQDMLLDLRAGTIVPNGEGFVQGHSQQNLAERYGVSRATAIAALRSALSEFETPTNSDI